MKEIKHIHLNGDTTEEILAHEEALLDYANTHSNWQSLHFWESDQHCVVLGRGNHINSEVHVEACQKEGIPILRRCSGGGTVLQGPGCLNYALILQQDHTPQLQNIPDTNRWILDQLIHALTPLLPSIKSNGDTDLSDGDIKISGNAQRRKKNALLFHGTLLINFDLDKINSTLKHPSKEPNYRKKRPHTTFLKNCALDKNHVQNALIKHFNAKPHPIPQLSILNTLLEKKYLNKNWHTER